MARDTVSRPVSGEILAGPANHDGNGSPSERDVVEAEYETIVGRYARKDRTVEGAGTDNASLFELNILSSRDKSESNGKAGPVFWAVGIVLVCAAFWISGGHTIMTGNAAVLASGPITPLVIEDVRSRVDSSGSRAYLLVEGAVANDGSQDLPLPDLIIQIKSNEGSITRYRIAGGSEEIVSGGRYAFSSRLGTPQSGIESVKVIIQDQN